MVLKTISPGCRVQASVMLFLEVSIVFVQFLAGPDAIKITLTKKMTSGMFLDQVLFYSLEKYGINVTILK